MVEITGHPQEGCRKTSAAATAPPPEAAPAYAVGHGRSAREPGLTPLVEFARIRNPQGIPSLDDAGNPRPAQRGELAPLAFWRANLIRLMLDQSTILACSQRDYETAPACAHGRRFASVELAVSCKCDVPAAVTSL